MLDPVFLNNDYSANGFLTRGTATIDPNDIIEEREVAFFLAMQNSITTKLQSSLEGVERFDEVLAEIANECISMYEAKLYILPSEKHLFLKVCLYSASKDHT
jgi:hypothetical protein